MQLAYSGGFKEAADTVAELEQAGLDLVWVAEAYGFDGASLMGYLAAKTETVQIASGILPICTGGEGQHTEAGEGDLSAVTYHGGATARAGHKGHGSGAQRKQAGGAPFCPMRSGAPVRAPLSLAGQLAGSSPGWCGSTLR